MSHFNVYNVKGDGNCFYRCIWNIAKCETEIADALCIEDLCNENVGMLEVRSFVAQSLKYESFAQGILGNLIKLYKDSPFLIENYPILKHIVVGADLATNCTTIANVIKNTNIYASGIEIDIIKHRFKALLAHPILDIEILVIAHKTGAQKSDLADKWLRELHAMMPNVLCERVVVLINEDNVHYRYGKFETTTVIEKKVLAPWLDDLMNEDSDEDSDDE
jgi:hypothetical protein